MGGHVIEVHEDHVTNFGDRKICGKGPCGFTDAITSSKDAKERSASKRKLLIAIVMIIVFMCVEVFVGIQANSLAILTDAAHLLTDVAAFAISLFSLCASEWEANPRQSYGFFRIEILGALFSMQLIWLLAGFLVYETIARLVNGTTGEVQGYLMFGASALGLVVNIAIALLLGHDHGHGHNHGHGHGHNHGHGHGHGHEHEHVHGHEHEHGHGITVTTHSHHHDAREPLLQHCLEGETKPEVVHKKERNINVEGAYLHVLGDSIQSLGVMIGGAIIWYKPEWKIIDLICTLVFSVIVVATTIRMLRNILNVLMESTPREIDATKVEKGLCEMDEVVAIHELHIWSMTAGKVLMACHVIVKPEVNIYMVLDKVTDYIKRKFNISHVTIQIERC